MQNLIIVDSHHKVLAAWAEYRNSLNEAPRLITFDHHTDTSKPFRKKVPTEELRMAMLASIDFKKPDTINIAIQKLNNDEHIITAIKTGIISSAFVVAHNAMNTDLATYIEHRVVCRNVENNDTVLESTFLNKTLASFDKLLKEISQDAIRSRPYILDIDLDYFNTFKSIRPDDANVIKALAKGAGLITIATEPEYVKSCAVDVGLNSDDLLRELLQILAVAQ